MPLWKSIPTVHLIGATILAVVVLYYIFMVANELGLPTATGTAIVTGKGYRKAGQTYYTQYIDGRPLVMPQTVPEMYLLKLQMGSHEAEAAVTQTFYETVKPNDVVQMTYQQKRFTKALRVLSVQGP